MWITVYRNCLSTGLANAPLRWSQQCFNTLHPSQHCFQHTGRLIIDCIQSKFSLSCHYVTLIYRGHFFISIGTERRLKQKRILLIHWSSLLISTPVLFQKRCKIYPLWVTSWHANIVHAIFLPSRFHSLSGFKKTHFDAKNEHIDLSQH